LERDHFEMVDVKKKKRSGGSPPRVGKNSWGPGDKSHVHREVMIDSRKWDETCDQMKGESGVMKRRHVVYSMDQMAEERRRKNNRNVS